MSYPATYCGENIPSYVSCYEINSLVLLAKFKHPTHQINFCTPQALQCLTFKGSEKVNK